MAVFRAEMHAANQAWAANGAINLELSPKPYTICEMWVICEANITTNGTPGTYNDPYDRFISNLNLVGNGKTYFGFSELRIAQHFLRFRRSAVKRPDAITASQTNVIKQWAYRFHFGVAARKVDPVRQMEHANYFDLTAGIPPASKGNLTLTGTFGGVNAPGSGYTVNSGMIKIFCYGVQPEPGDTAGAYLPRAIPVWQMRSPGVSSSSTVLATQDNVPAGGFLHSMTLMTTATANAPRSNTVLNSVQVYNQLENRAIWTVTGFDGGTLNDYLPAEIISQADSDGWPVTDDPSVTTGTPTVTQASDQGLVYLPLFRQANKGNPYFGVDMRNVATGDLQLRYGVNGSLTTPAMDVLYEKYELNPDHPANS